MKNEEKIQNWVGRMAPLRLGALDGHKRGDAPQTSAKSENQNHALPFARGEVIETIDMNQDMDFEEALKMRMFLEEFQFQSDTDIPRYTLVGCPEQIYTESVSLIGRFMALQDMSFVTIVQRVLAYTAVRMHYGHPDIFDGYWCRFHIGLSKASPETNLSEDLFFGLDNLARHGQCTFVEYIRFAKGREVGLNTTAIFEDKLARGAAMTLKSPDVYRLSRWLGPIMRLSLLVGNIGHYLFTTLFDYTITSFLWIIILMAIAQVSSEEIGKLGSVYAIPWLFHLGYGFGLPLLFQLMYDYGLFHGAFVWARNLILGSVYYLFQLRTKAYGTQQGLAGGSSHYAATGRGFPLQSECLIELYRAYARSHYHHALQLLLLLCIYSFLLSGDQPLGTILLKTYAILLASLSWLLAPALFNPLLDGTAFRRTATQEFERLTTQLKDVVAWVRRPYRDPVSGECARESWERWWWEYRFENARLRAMRYKMAQCRGGWSAGSHPLITTLIAFFTRVLDWLPWTFLTYGLFLRCHDVLLSVLLYVFLVMFVHLLAPKRLHLIALCTLVMLYYTYMQVDNMAFHPLEKYWYGAWTVPLDRLPDVLAAIAVLHVMGVISADLLLYLCDMWLTLQLVFSPVYITASTTVQPNYNSADNTTTTKKETMSSKGKEKKKNMKRANLPRTSSECYSQQHNKNNKNNININNNKTEFVCAQRPWLVGAIMNARLFFSWQATMRYVAPYSVALSHLAVLWLLSRCSSLHARVLLDLDLSNLKGIKHLVRHFPSSR